MTTIQNVPAASGATVHDATVHGSVVPGTIAPGTGTAGTGTWELAGRTLTSRLITGTGGATSLDVMSRVLHASGSRVTTVAMRRVGGYALGGGSLLELIRQARARIPPNPAGAPPPAARSPPPRAARRA